MSPRGTPIDLNGKTFGKLTVLSRHGTGKWNQPQWECICVCGNSVIVYGYELRSGRKKTCGCGKAREIEPEFLQSADELEYDMESRKGLGLSLRKRRKAQGVSVDQTARDAGVAAMTLRSVEGTVRNSRDSLSHTLSVYARIARVLGVRIEYTLVDERTGERIE